MRARQTGVLRIADGGVQTHWQQTSVCSDATNAPSFLPTEFACASALAEEPASLIDLSTQATHPPRALV